MALIPFGEDNFPRLHLHDFMRDFNRMENDLYRQVAPYWRNANQSLMHVGNDASELVNDDKKFAVNLNVSQFRPDELKVHIEGHQLTIEGKQEHKDEHSHSQRSFLRTFTLPADVNLEGIRSHLTDDGHLSVEAPKAVHALQHKKQIPIQLMNDGKKIGVNVNSSQSVPDMLEIEDEEQLMEEGEQEHMDEPKRSARDPRRISFAPGGLLTPEQKVAYRKAQHKKKGTKAPFHICG